MRWSVTEVMRPNTEMAIWGDPKTGLPILVEMKNAMLADAKVTMTDFEFDVELDEALFKTEPPEGYRLQAVQRHTLPSETDLIATLKLLSERNDGQFPDTFNNATISTLLTKGTAKTLPPGPTRASSSNW